MILLVVGAGELADGLKVALQHGDAPLLVVLADAPQQLAMLETNLVQRHGTNPVTLIVAQNVGRNNQQQRHDNRIVHPAPKLRFCRKSAQSLTFCCRKRFFC